MKIKYLLKLFIIIAIVTSCNNKTKNITQISDYDHYLDIKENEMLSSIITDYEFWEKKYEKESNQFPYLYKMAASQSNIFKTTGDITYLKEAEKNLVKAIKSSDFQNVSYLHTLSSNYIAQHRFREALTLLELSEKNGHKLVNTQKMLFDVHLELGNEIEAEYYLEKFVDYSSFDFLIRLSKWNDHNGNLNKAIKNLEKALDIAEASKNKSLIQWTYTNLADFYGHNGQIQDSYQYFLKTLEIDPNNAYAKKGIAWIIYSFERNPREALRILNSVLDNYNSPDLYLLKAEIAEFMNDQELKEKSVLKFYSLIKNENYGAMYNMHNAKLFAEEFKKINDALVIAQTEIKNRPTAQSYDLLAWVKFNDGEFEEALRIAENHVLNKTYEPETIYHLAEIYKANGLTNKVKTLKKELLNSSFELGPLTTKKVIQL